MLLILVTIFIVGLLTYLSFKPLIDNLLFSVSNESTFVHSYMPIIGFGLEMSKDPIEFLRSLHSKYGKSFVIYLQSKRWLYLNDERAFLTKVLKNPDLSIDEFFADVSFRGFGIPRECSMNECIQRTTLKQYHQYLIGDELEILNRRVHDSIIRSLKIDAQNSNKILNFFDFFSELMLYAGCDSLFGEPFTTEQRNQSPNFYKLFKEFDLAVQYGVFQIPFWKIFFRSTNANRYRFIKRFHSLKLNNGESKLIHERDEFFHSNTCEYSFNEHGIASQHASTLWAAIANTAPMSCWSVIDLILHPEALQAVKQELDEHVSSTALIYNKETLSKLKILESCINETLRRTLNIGSIRQAINNTTIECSDKTTIGVRKGDMIMYPASLKHFDPNLFGPNPYAYQYNRFIKKSDQPKVPSTMFFGCGTHICPGRFWAINEIKILVALIIQHMNIEFVNMTDEDRNEYRKRLPYDYSKFISASGPKKGYEHKFDIKYVYKNL